MRTIKNIILLFAIFTSTLSFGKEIIVTSTDDSGTGTFREAVGLAQPNDTIIINVKGTITLNSSIVFNNKQNLTIIGPYPKHNTFTSTASTNMFYLYECDTVSFKGLGFIGANGVQSVIKMNNSSNIIFKECLFENNVCTSNGTINSTISQFFLVNTAFINNQSSNGGAIYINDMLTVAGEIEISNTTFYQNNSTGGGGAIYATNSNTQIVLTNNLFKENNSVNNGEAIHLNSGTMFMYNNIITQNGSGSEYQLIGAGTYNTGTGNNGNILEFYQQQQILLIKV